MHEENRFPFYHHTSVKNFSFISFILFTLITFVVIVQIFVARHRTIRKYNIINNYHEDYAISKKLTKELLSATLGIYIPLIVGGLLEAAGYIIKIVSTSNVYSMWLYVVQAVLIIMAPGMICCTLHMQFYSSVRFLNCPSNSGVSLFVKDSLMVKLLVASSVVSFLLQGAGAALDNRITGNSPGVFFLKSFGFMIQLANVLVFLIIQINFMMKRSKYSAENYCNTIDKKWVVLNYCTVGSSSFILIRTIVRFIDVFMGWNKKTVSYEVLLFVFEAVFMVIVMILVAVPFFFVHSGTLYVWYCSYSKESFQSDYKLPESDDEYDRVFV